VGLGKQQLKKFPIHVIQNGINSETFTDKMVLIHSTKKSIDQPFMPLADDSSTLAYRFAANQAICVSPCIQKSRRIYVRPRTGPQSAHLWWPAVAKLQAATVQCVGSGSYAMGQIDGRRDRWTDRDIPKCPLGREHDKKLC